MTDKTEAMEHVIHSSMPIDFERRYAMDNLIAQDADLIETLLEVGRDGVWKSGHNPATAHPMCVKAADRIKALEAENARLRERVKRVENNNRELRGSKERVYAATDLRQPTQSDALREALEAAPLIGRTESVYDFMERQEAWLKGPYRAALEQSK